MEDLAALVVLNELLDSDDEKPRQLLSLQCTCKEFVSLIQKVNRLEMSADTILELQQQRDALKSNIQDVDENIKKLTGRDPGENRRTPANRRIQLKRSSFGRPDSNQTPIKRTPGERRRWGSTALKTNGNMDSGGEDNDEKKPTVHSSVVATGKPIEPLQKPVVDDVATKKRNRRMFGLLVGTLKQFKKESQVKTEQDYKREEKLTKVEEQVQKEKADALEERKELYQTRRNKQIELRKLEFKLEMAELGVDIKAHYEKFNSVIRLKSTPRVFYKPAIHNEHTKKLLKETQEMLKDSLDQRIKEVEFCQEEDIKTSRSFIRNREGTKGPGKTAKDPIVIDAAPSKRDLFAEDADDDKRENESLQTEQTEKDDLNDASESADIAKAIDTSHENTNGMKAENDEELSDGAKAIIVGEDSVGDERRVVSNPSYDVVDERFVEMNSGDTRNIDVSDVQDEKMLDISKGSITQADDVNIYEDMQPGIELFQPDESDLME